MNIVQNIITGADSIKIHLLKESKIDNSKWILEVYFRQLHERVLTARQRSGEGNVFNPVCQPICSRGGGLM